MVDVMRRANACPESSTSGRLIWPTNTSTTSSQDAALHCLEIHYPRATEWAHRTPVWLILALCCGSRKGMSSEPVFSNVMYVVLKKCKVAVRQQWRSANRSIGVLSVLRQCKVLLTEAVKWLSSSSEEVLTEALSGSCASYGEGRSR